MKLNKDVLKKIKHVEIHTRRLLSGTMVGDYSSAQKGTGLEFDQIRDYQMGDDVRFIDWSASARNNKLLVKQFIEERNRTVMLLVDLSGSTFFGSSQLLKSEVISEVASILALVADYGKDHIGALLFSDEVEKVIPPSRGKKHVHMLMEDLFTSKPSGKTSLNNALKRLMSLQKQDAIVFIISDFLATGYERLLKIAARKHDVIAVRCIDLREETFPFKAFVSIKDAETGIETELETGAHDLELFLKEYHLKTESTMKKCGVDILDVQTNRPFMGEIVRFFRKRMRY